MKDQKSLLNNFECEFLNFQDGFCNLSYFDPSSIKTHELWSANKWWDVKLKNISDFLNERLDGYTFKARKHPGTSCNDEDFYCGVFRYDFVAFQVNGTTSDNEQFCERLRLYAPKFTKISPPSMMNEISATKNTATVSYELSNLLPTFFLDHYKCTKEGSENGSNDLLCYIFNVTLRSCNNFVRYDTFYYNPTKSHKFTGLPNAFAQYEATVVIRTDRSDYWSDPYKFSFQTGPDIPRKSPRKLAYNTVDNDLFVFWESIDNCDEGGPNLRYDVKIKDWDVKNKCTIKPYMIICKNFPSNKLSKVSIQTRNDVNFSTEISKFEINFNSDSSESTISVEQDYNTGLGIHTLNFKNNSEPTTLFWCETKSFRPNECDSPMEFVEFGNWNKSGLVDSRSLMFGASISDGNSSEIVWSTCKKSNTLMKVKDFKALGRDENSVELGWIASCEHSDLLKDYLLDCECEFLFETREKCICPDTVISKYDIKYNVTNLKPYTLYNLTIFMRDQLDKKSDPSTVKIETIESIPSKVESISHNTTDTKVSLSWDLPKSSNGLLSGYKIYFQKITEETKKYFFTSNETRNFTVTSLEPDTKYYYWIEACIRNGKLCSRFERKLVRTEIGRPVRVDLTSDCKHNITWELGVSEKPHFFEVEVNGIKHKTFDKNYTHDVKKNGRIYSASVYAVNVRLSAEEKNILENGSPEKFKNLMMAVDCEKRDCIKVATQCHIESIYSFRNIVLTVMLIVMTIFLATILSICVKWFHDRMFGIEVVLPDSFQSIHERKKKDSGYRKQFPSGGQMLGSSRYLQCYRR